MHPSKNLNLVSETGIGGRYRVRVMNVTKADEGGNPIEWEPATEWGPEQKNLILPAGFNGGNNWQAQSRFCHAGTGTTPNKVTLDGTFSQTGTTLTRVSGTGVFSSGNINDFIKFASGERAKIVSYTNTLTVVVDRSQEVAASGLSVYDTSRTQLDTWVQATSTLDGGALSNGTSNDNDTGTCRYWRTLNFTMETVAKTYTEIGMAAGGTSSSTTLFSRIVLETPVSVDVGQFLQVRFDLLATAGNFRTATPVTANITGWPRPYSVTSITPGVASGTAFDILLSEACSSHYVVGRQITIAGALPAKTTISSISSTGSDFTVTANAHGKTAGQSIVIEGSTPSGYNGTWTIASVTTNTLTITSGINPGAGSGGTVRLATPATWFNGTWTIASFPTTSTIRVTNATVTVPAGASGSVKNSLGASGIISGTAFYTGNANSLVDGPSEIVGNKNLFLMPESSLVTGITYGTTKSTSGSLSTTGMTTSHGTYNAGTRSRTFTFTIPASQAVSQQIRQIAFTGSSGQFWITFDERQRKDDGYQLVITLENSWEPELI